MNRLLTVLLGLSLFSVPAVALAQFDNGTVAKIQEEINLNQARADQLNPIIARDTQARNDTGTDAAQLDRAAQGMHSRAVEFRNVGATLPGGQQKGQLMQTANELDGYATHNEQLAAAQRDLANRLNGLVNLMVEGRNQHLAAVQRLRALLGGGGF